MGELEPAGAAAAPAVRSAGQGSRPASATTDEAGARWWIWIVLIAVAGAVPRVVGLRESLAWDELYLYAWVHDRGFGEMLELVRAREKTPPLGFALAWLADSLGGPPQAIRVPQLAAGIAIVPLTAILARQAFNPRAGTVAAALAAASPFLLFYSVEARSYSLTTALCLASATSLLAAAGSGRRIWWVACSLTAAAALLSHYTAAAVIAAQFAWALIAMPERRKATIACIAGPAIAMIAWLPGLIDQVGISSDELARINAVAPLALDTVMTIVGRNLIGHPLVGLGRLPGAVATWTVIAGVALAAGASLLAAARRGQQGEGTRLRDPAVLLVFALAVAAPVLAILVSLQPQQSMLFARNLMVSLPAALVLVAALLASPSRAVATVASLMAVGGMAAGSAIELSDAERPAAREAALAIAERWRPGDRIVELCCLTGAEGPLGSAVEVNLPRGQRDSLSVLTRTGDLPYRQSLADGGRLFVVGYVPEGSRTRLFYSPPAGWEAKFRPVWEKRWPGILETVATEYSPGRG